MHEDQRRGLSRGAWAGVFALALVVTGLGAGLVFTRVQDAAADFEASLNAFRAAANQPGETFEEWRGDEARTFAERLPGVEIPTDAQDLYYAREGRLNPLFWLRLTATQAQIEAILPASCRESLEAGYNPGFAYGTDADLIAQLDWWQPDSAAQGSGARCQPAPSAEFHVWIDQSGALWTVYLEIVT